MPAWRIPVVWFLPLAVIAGCSAPAPSEAVVRDFTFPWSDRPAPATEFRARIVGDRLDFTFVVEDSDLIVRDDWDGESTLDVEDRVEIFFARDESLNDYWCLEIDPLGRVHDYHARHYRIFDSDWNCPGLETTGERTTTGYVVRGSLPLATLSELLNRPIERGSVVRLGLFRAEFYGTTPATHGEADDNWISWIDPDIPRPDFHTPTAFADWALP